MELEAYRRKRNFDHTPEPSAQAGGGQGWSYVIQEHEASRHHFDFRLEMDGVLTSWAVPKEIPQQSGMRRLAVHVEDHPLDYGKFEGTIPEGNYGAGTVRIWDHGKWRPAEEGEEWREEFKNGKLKFTLQGERLNGSWVLIRTRGQNWLMQRLGGPSSGETSNSTGRIPQQHPRDKNTPVEKSPAFIPPQLCRVAPAVPAGEAWLHEIKLDGYRLIAVKKGGVTTLFTRSGLDWTDKFPEMAQAVTALDNRDFTLDGEAVVFDSKGRSRFAALQTALKKGKRKSIVLVVFDLLHLDGVDLRDLSLTGRLEKLKSLVDTSTDKPVRRSEVWPAGEGAKLFRHACRKGLEGIISKKADGPYLSGSRVDWTKSKCRPRQEFIICGYTPPKSSLPAFSSLVLASNENGRLVPRGRVGTGFTAKGRRELLKQLKELEPAGPAFPVEGRVHWVTPRLVAEVEFAELTRDGLIRQGSFMGLRGDKKTEDVHLEEVAPAAASAGEVKVLGIRISHPDRPVFPADHVSKMDVARWYERVGEWMLPYVAKRPLAVIRAPEGIGKETFFQKSFAAHVPEKVTQHFLEDGTRVFTVDSLTGLISLVQYGTIEFHPWGAAMKDPEKADSLIWDLDPGPAVPWGKVVETAEALRRFLAERALETVVKTSGGKGLHVMLFIKPAHGWETIHAFAKAAASAVASASPEELTIEQDKAGRKGRIYIDWMRNSRGATCAAPWCLRARPGASISMPVSWDRLAGIAPAGFTIHDPPEMPEEWRKPARQTLKKAVLHELGIL
ncbi:MAG: ATP-dependent ligase [Verrucomicrobiales bacterium]|nr:ATP-dependent ligase [Verrucomicrobiales bacterium]